MKTLSAAEKAELILKHGAVDKKLREVKLAAMKAGVKGWVVFPFKENLNKATY